jgi:hypothetical protein
MRNSAKPGKPSHATQHSPESRIEEIQSGFQVRWLLAILFSCAGAAPVLAASDVLPLVTNPLTRLNYPGKVVLPNW